ncbi:MAG TPA: ABC transporter permease, partial [Holophaga sp.]|nr:ABC transporter permease [Holophaga sp.]
MIRMVAIIERELRKFFRSPTLMLATMVFPLVQLVILGNAFGGKITEARVGVVDYDGGGQARKLWEAFDSIGANIRTFRPVRCDSDKQAQEDVRAGRLDAAIIIPPRFSRRVYAGENPRLGLVVD